ncbi:MAG TPA: discoidin domain-containing protein [Polyangiaceae bacterium]|nr:discoidin domain-containing protein [Polyangiaceae bacterium]
MTTSESVEREQDSGQVAASSPPVARPARGGVLEWVWRGRALRAAEERDALATDARRLALGLELTEVADRAVERLDPLRSGNGAATAFVLYREAFRVFAGLPGVDSSAPSPPEMDDAALASASDADRQLLARRARAAVHDLVARLPGAGGERRRLIVQRVTRTILVVTAAAALVVGIGLGIARALRPPNVLVGATVRTSSSYAGFSPEDHMCDGKKTSILFHTDREENPYADFDMKTPRTISHVLLGNRRDCCEERATPLVVEVSTDGSHFKEVFRRVEPFQSVSGTFPPTAARVVRVRALKRTWLHLEQVAAW